MNVVGKRFRELKTREIAARARDFHRFACGPKQPPAYNLFAVRRF
jgi:hypothetical protein